MISKLSRSINADISSATFRPDATTSASASVAADRKRSELSLRIEEQRGPSGSRSKTAINAEVSTAITSATRFHHHRGSPGCGRQWHLAWPWLQRQEIAVPGSTTSLG